MTKEDVEAQEGNPDFINELCVAIMRELLKQNFSLTYIKKKVEYLSVFVNGLEEKES